MCAMQAVLQGFWYTIELRARVIVPSSDLL
jgi:hypothetical protein